MEIEVRRGFTLRSEPKTSIPWCRVIHTSEQRLMGKVQIAQTLPSIEPDLLNTWKSVPEASVTVLWP
jgi:hypothetical protein